MLRALQIERRLSKKEILELYLTLAPYGGNIEGVRAASRLYFGKEPSALTNAEQALLIALPQAPEARRPDLKPQNAAAARADILKKLAEAELLSAMDAREARAATLPGKRTPLPRIAHHATRELAMGADQHTVQSSLDQALQARAEALIRTYVEALDDKDATAAALIVETDTRKVRAAVGSSSLDRPGGWIDLTAATRSPGSTLKPFIYALAFEDGFAGPSTIIDDMPRAFGDYAPENFDRRFRGEVRVREALQHSLNLPAVAMLERIGAPRFAAVLNAVGVGVKTPQRADEEPGLAIALGGAGVTARDLAALYAALGDDGAVRSLQWTEEPGGKAAEGRRLMTAQSAARISAILADAPSLAGRAPAALSENAVRVAFKTGTSYGYRDAWAAGHGGGFTVVVWTGRADGAPRPGATGRKAAAPLLFDLFDMLERHGASGAEPGLHSDEPDAPALARFAPARQAQPPQIIFPRDGVEVYLAGAERGLALAARGGASDYAWYVDGEPLPREASSGRAVWRPARAGFYNVTVVDAEGRAARSKVRVRASG
ncbi:MAG: penicillin-binding protein 1C, partial [Hyphococcus sp.]